MQIVSSIAERNSLAGVVLSTANTDGTWTCYFDGDELPTTADTVESLRVRLSDAVDALAADLRGGAVRKINPYVTAEEMAAWPVKREQATAYALSQNPADCPDLAAEAAWRQTTIASIVQRVIKNNALIMPMESAIAGVAGLHKDRIKALAAAGNIAALQQYDITTDWPTL